MLDRAGLVNLVDRVYMVEMKKKLVLNLDSLVFGITCAFSADSSHHSFLIQARAN